MLVGDDANPLDPDLCAEIALAQYTELVAIVVNDGEAQATATLETFAGDPAAADDNAWSIRDAHADVELLDDITPANVEDMCTAAATAQIMLAFR